jgi:hypothetical protein
MKSEKMVKVEEERDESFFADFVELKGKDKSQDRYSGAVLPKVKCRKATLHLNMKVIEMLNGKHMVNLLKHKSMPLVVIQPVSVAGENTLEVQYTYSYDKGDPEKKEVTGASLWTADFFKTHPGMWDKMQGYTFVVGRYPNGWLYVDYSIPHVNGVV